MILTLYQNIAENNRVDKSQYLKELADYIVGVFREDTSILTPTIELDLRNISGDDISGKIPNFNYVYISEFSRYYFVDDIEVVTNDLIRIYLTVDVLYTWQNYIENLTAFVERNEFDYNPELIDKNLVIEKGEEKEFREVNNRIFYDDNETPIGFYSISGFRIRGVVI